jgi:hypothetical protein
LQPLLVRRRPNGLCLSLVVSAAIGILVLVRLHSSAEEVETLLEFRVDERELIFRVMSHGCTNKSDFEVRIATHLADDREIFVTLLRRKWDPCKGFFRDGIEIVFTREELGLSSHVIVRITNPEIAQPK